MQLALAICSPAMLNDPSGDLPSHVIGEVVHLAEKPWKVVAVENKPTASEPHIPVHHVFLTDKL